MCGDDTPRALDTHLHQERTAGECDYSRGESPQVDNREGECGGHHDGTSSTQRLTPQPKRPTADDGANVVNDRDGCRLVDIEVMLLTQKQNIQVLRAVTEEIER